MNPLSFLGPYRWLLYAGVALAIFTGGAVLVHRHDKAQQEIGAARVQAKWDAERAAQASEVLAQVDRNHELQRAAELHYTVQAQVRDHYIVQTVKEIHNAAAPLASCPVPEPVRVRLNAAAACAREDRAAACGADKPL